MFNRTQIEQLLQNAINIHNDRVKLHLIYPIYNRMGRRRRRRREQCATHVTATQLAAPHIKQMKLIIIYLLCSIHNFYLARAPLFKYR